MSAIFIIVIAPLGVAALIGLVYLFGGSKQASITTAGEALDRFRRDYPHWQDDQVLLSEDGQVALIPSAGDQIGLVFSVGDTFVTRLLNREDIAAASDADAPAQIHFHDFSAPDIRVPRSLVAQLDARAAA